MYQDSKRTCTAIVLLIKPFVLWRSRCRRRRGLLKVPNDYDKETWRMYVSKQRHHVDGIEKPPSWISHVGVFYFPRTSKVLKMS